VFTWLGLYLQHRFGLGEVGIGLALLGYGVPGFLLGPLIGRRLADRRGRARLIPPGVAVGACSRKSRPDVCSRNSRPDVAPRPRRRHAPGTSRSRRHPFGVWRPAGSVSHDARTYVVASAGRAGKELFQVG